MKNIFPAFLVSILLAACGGGSSSDDDSGDTNPSNEPGNTYEPPVTETPDDDAEEPDDTPDNDLPPAETPVDNEPGGDVPPVDAPPAGETPSDDNPSDDGPSGSLPPGEDQPGETPDNDQPQVSLVNGQQEYVAQCQTCHGEQGNGTFKIDASKFNQVSLASYIALEMPVNQEGKCVDNCATDITAYIFNSYAIDDAGAEPDDDGEVVAQCNRTTYGPRQLKLLTRTEYQNSLEDLVGIDFDVTASLPFDTLVHGYTNNAGTVITENHTDAYLSVAERAAEFAARQNFAQVIDCGQGNAALPYEQCTQKFLDGFGTRVFRRPLTAEERATYTQLFDNRLTGGDIAEALQLGITALLTAPQFLYRSEVGDAVENVLNGEAGEAGNVIPDSEARTLAGPDFRQKTTGQRADDGGWNIYSEGYIEDAFNFTDQALIRISMKGDIAQNQWPIMELLIDNQVRATTAVETGEYTTFQFPVNGFSGTHNVQIRFINDFFQNGEDRNLYVRQVTVSGAKAAPAPAQPAGDTTDLARLDSDAYVLSAYELASYLSYTFTGSTPDAELLAAAEKGELQTEQQLRGQIQRLLQSERAIEHMGNFAAQWLGTDAILNEQKNSDLFPGFTQSVREAMAEEVRAMFTHVFYDESESFASLFNADYVFANNVLASFYGLGGINSAQMVKVENVLDRGGLLTTGAFLATYADADESSPIKRAVTIRERLMCQDIAPPPNNIGEFRTEEEERLKQELAGQVISNRDFVAAITANELCATCHEKIINPLGFGLEDFDASGRHRSQDFNGLSIDSSGVLFGLSALDDGASAAFYGAKDLSNLLADTRSTQSCFAANAFRFAMDIGHDQIDKDNPAAGRLQPDEVADYGCSVSTLTSTLDGGNQTPKALFQALGTLEVVRYRKQRNR